MDKHSTRSGTPWASTWDEVWGATVERHEDELGRRICGAKTLAGNPCTLTSRHRTGRCAFHGGTDAIGAPEGNSNARIHGLYARRLQRCGTHCPMWQHCPFATGEVLALELPERPVCAYESAEYEEALKEFDGGGPTSMSAESPDEPRPRRSLALPNVECDDHSREKIREDRTNPCHPWSINVQNLALLQVMVSRAAAALSVLSLTDNVTSESDRYHLHTTKVHAALEAFLRLTREHRAALAQYHRDLDRQVAANNNGHVPSLADLAAPILEQAEGVMEEAIEVEQKRRAYTKKLETLLDEVADPEWRQRINAPQDDPAIESEPQPTEPLTNARAP